jgi:hypothetical protein
MSDKEKDTKNKKLSTRDTLTVPRASVTESELIIPTRSVFKYFPEGKDKPSVPAILINYVVIGEGKDRRLAGKIAYYQEGSRENQEIPLAELVDKSCASDNKESCFAIKVRRNNQLEEDWYFRGDYISQDIVPMVRLWKVDKDKNNKTIGKDLELEELLEDNTYHV